MLARSCFQRARRARHGATLRNIGRDYLMKATKVTSATEPQQSTASVRVTNEAA
jgi:hypothetical protein